MTEASKSSEPTRLALVSPWLETATRSSILVVGTLYVIGLLILNIEMASYGVFSMGLGRAEYVLVGTTWAALTGFDLSLVLYGLSALRKRPQNSGSDSTFKAGAKMACDIVFALFVVVIAPGGPLGAIYYLNLIMDPSRAIAMEPSWTTIIVQVLALHANVGLLAFGYYRFTSPSADAHSDSSWVKFGVYGYGVFHFTVFLIFALMLYTVAVFPVIPQALGGGLRPLTNLILAESGRGDSQSLGLPMVEEKGLIGPLRCSSKLTQCTSC